MPPPLTTTGNLIHLKPMTKVAGLLLLSLPVWTGAAEPRLEGVTVRDDGVVIETSEPVPYTKSRASDPERLIFEFAGLRCARCPREWKGQGKWLEGARAGQFREEPPVTRVVLDLTGNAPVADTADGALVTVTLGAATPAPVVVQKPRANPVVAPKPAPVPAVAAPAPIAPKPVRHPVRRAPTQDAADLGNFLLDLSWAAYATLAFAAITLCVALYRIRFLMSNVSAVKAAGEQEARRVEKKVNEDLLMVRRRLSAIESKLAQLQEERGGGGGSVDPEQLKELRAVMKSLSETPLFPKG